MNSDKLNIPKIDYFGKIIIQARKPKQLANWYTEKFGLKVNLEFRGEFHGGFKNNDMNFLIEIVKNRNTKENINNISLTFHVNDFKSYVHVLKLKHIIPYRTEFNHEGEFAFYRDLENNKISIWGTIN